MNASRRPHLLELQQLDHAALRAELAAGLLAPAAHIAPKFLYDRLGSSLFAAITEVDEYYPTRTEAWIFQHHADEIAACTGQGGILVDLGAGNCAKAARLFPKLQPAHYVAVDISVEFLAESLGYLQFLHPEIGMSGVGCDFSRHLQLPAHLLPAHLVDAPRTLFYPGSSIGNFDPDTAVAFLRQAHAASQGGGLLIGFDLVKEQALLDDAYNDALGITAAFNLNLLKVLRTELDATLKIGHFRHIAFFNAAKSRIEMHLEARRTTSIRWDEHERRFMPGERIHTEYSHKYTLDSASALLESAGFRQLRWWSDPQQWFTVCWARG